MWSREDRDEGSIEEGDSWENLEGWKVARCMKVKYRRKTHCSMLADHTGQIYPENKTKKPYILLN